MLKKLAIDLIMTVLILLAFAYQLTGNTVHELIGFVVLGFFLVHNLALNGRWYATLLNGKYNGRRIVSIAVNLLVLATTLTLVVSGLVNSRLIGGLLGVEGDFLPREIHTTSAYWFLVLMSIHLGMHWRLIMAEMRKRGGISASSRWRTMLSRCAAALIAAYGVHASLERNLYAKLIAYFSFDYWNFDESVLSIVLYFAQYLAIIGVYVCLTHYVLKWSQKERSSASATMKQRPTPARRKLTEALSMTTGDAKPSCRPGRSGQ
ncbi:DUF4405 domain-containing protein [Propionivibrio limicola]|uniref:DUF4405 domain-containing protein n=1 Tax=Propionivibrio limicola TaxID=167645 RepID=UPI001291F84B|nr:DUF4405 domain-containing protein [Propionivibrio limicola]